MSENKFMWHGPAESESWYQCPCCDYFSLAERGSYSICPVCFWEDEGQGIGQLDDESGANHGVSLRKARANFKEFGASVREMVQKVISEEKRRRYEYRPRMLE